MSELPPFAHLGRELIEHTSGRYFLIVRTDDNKDLLLVPFGLDGSEPYEQARARFQDALIVSRNCLSEKGEYRPTGAGIDGRPRTDLEKASAAVQAEMQEVGASRILETQEWTDLVSLRDES